jgi:aspartate-semialdehyde dehydrogenase
VSGSGLTVGVLGATGAVGSTILSILDQREFPASEVVAFASERSAGKEVPFGEGTLTCVVPDEETIQGIDILISSAGGSVSEVWAPKFVEAGAVVVDNTSFWRMHDDVPLVVAEVNPERVDDHQGIIANPNCTTAVMLMALAPIHREVGLKRLILSSYQAVSGTGQKAIEELESQTRAVLAHEAPSEPSVYPHRIAFNVLPQVEVFKDGDDYTTEERKVMAETRKIMGLGDEVAISATCARVPVVTGHSESLNIETNEDLSPERCREILAGAPGVTVVDDPSSGGYPTALDAAGVDDVLVGRIRRDPDHPNTLNLWLAGDNLRKGAALNAVQVAELLVAEGLVGG